jgi:Tol biopolymer transport system component
MPLELPPGFQSFYPAVAWSPQGDWIALNGCACDGGKAPGLWVVAADGSDVHEVTSSEGDSAWGPVWSPDGTRIAFSRQPTDCATCDETLWVANIAHESLTIIADLVGSERSIAWSPDGRLIAVASLQITGTASASQPDERSVLIVVSADASDPQMVVASGGIKRASGRVSGEWMETGDVAWSSDGERLLYLSSTQDEYPSSSIREVAAAGGESRIVMPNVEAFDIGDAE